ncbi:MAG: aminoglycoside phosphotransferase family protein [Candidatus Thorarchaeota archaeon]|nr:aminoglycoside phosphotransferase family protein [Candidatus Thorarchaeota archaeon]
MTNLNLLARTEDKELVIKFPGSISRFQENPFLQEFSLMKYFSELDLSPKPLATGFLALPYHLPFLAYAFEMGQIRSRIMDLSLKDWNVIVETLERVHHSTPPKVEEFNTAIEFLASLTSPLNAFSADSGDPRLRETRSRFDDSSLALCEIIDSTNWTKSTIHGDLRLSNIVFQDDHVILLDWACCGRASYLFDYAYFYTEPAEETPFPFDSPINAEPEKTRKIMEALALVSALSWTIEQLYRTELGIVEPSLLQYELPENVALYAISKLRKLESTVRTLSLLQ